MQHKFNKTFALLTLCTITILNVDAMAAKVGPYGAWPNKCTDQCYNLLKLRYNQDCLAPWNESKKDSAARKVFEECKEEKTKEDMKCLEKC